MKFRLKIGHLFGPMNPESSNGRTYGMYMVPWIKSVKETLGSGLKETKAMADHLRASVESVNGKSFMGAYIDVDAVQFPFLAQHTFMRPHAHIEVINENESPGLACTVSWPGVPNKSVEIVKEAMCKLIELGAWNNVRRLAEVLMDIEDEQSV